LQPLLLPCKYFFYKIIENGRSTYLLFSLHPTAGLALAVNSVFPAEQSKINWNGFNSFFGLIMLTMSSLIYIALYLFNERVISIYKNYYPFRIEIVIQEINHQEVRKIVQEGGIFHYNF